MKKKLPLIIFLLVLAAGIGFGVFYHHNSKPKFNDDYVNGNTAGNLYGAGLFCEYNEVIYFANPSDKCRLYSMNTDGTNLKKLSDDIASFINVDDNYIYYVRNNPTSDEKYSFINVNTDSLCRADHDGKNVIVLDAEPCMYASLFGNYVFYLHYEESTGTTLYKVKIDGTEKQQVETSPYQTCSANEQYFYYVGAKGNVWRYDTASLSTASVYTDNCWMPTVLENGDIYYMDCNNNYKLTRSDLLGGDKIHLAADRLDSYNLCGDYIYFQRSSETEPALCRIRTDGSDYRVIADGVFTDINATSTNVYFRDFSSGIMYYSPIDAPDEVSIFSPGK